MKIIIHSLEELQELAALIYGNKSEREIGRPAALAVPYIGKLADATDDTDQKAHERQAIERMRETGDISEGSANTKLAELDAADPVIDSAGLPWDERIHSSTKAFNKDGTWRARRGVDAAVVAAVEQELRAQLSAWEVPADEQEDQEAEPVATETHALPRDESSGEHAQPEARSVDSLAELIATSTVEAGDMSDNHMDLLKACQGFIAKYGHAAFNELKAAVAPADGSESGKSLQQFSPAERRLMQACIANY